MILLLPIKNRSNVQLQPGVVKYEESLQNDKDNVETAHSRPCWIETWGSSLLLHDGDQLQHQKGDVTRAEEHGEDSLDGTGMALMIRKSAVSSGYCDCHLM